MRLLNRVLGCPPSCGLDSLKPGEIVLLVIKKNDFANDSMLALNFLSCKYDFGVCFTANKTFSSMAESFVKMGAKLENVFFIDAISNKIFESPQEARNRVYLNSFYNLKDVSSAVASAFEKRGSGSRFLFFDSLPSLCAYHGEEHVSKFLFFLAGHLRSINVTSVFLVDDEGAAKEFARYCDRVVYFKKR